MKTILVPTDFSPMSLKALDVAVQLAGGAKVLLMDVLKYPEPVLIAGGVQAEDPDDVFERQVEGIENRLRCLAAQYPNVSPIVLRQEGSIGETIATHEVDLIVMASEGASGWKEKTTGSNAGKVVRKAKCPVLVIKDDITLPIRRVLFPTDFTHTDFIQRFLSLPLCREAAVSFVTVNTGLLSMDTQQLWGKMRKLAAKIGLESYDYGITDAPNESAGIIQFAGDVEADLIALYTHGRDGFAHWFKGSVAEDVVNHSDLPVLTWGLEEEA